MPLVIDHQVVDRDAPATIGEVLARLQKQNRLVVHLLIDGEEPDFQTAGNWRGASTANHTVFVETTEPQTMARDVLEEVEHFITAADDLGRAAAGHLQAGQHNKAMEGLSACFKRWHHVQEAVLKTSQLLRMDLNRVLLEDGRPLSNFLGIFGVQLRSIRDALEMRDYVTLADVLSYELPESVETWKNAINAIRAAIE
jgi:hypothetical protein